MFVTFVLNMLRKNAGYFGTRIGFRGIGHAPDFALEHGRKVGRAHKRFDL
jgi:hypothetical protein